MSEVLLAVFAGALFLWLPGLFILLSLRMEKLVALALAPIVSTLLYSFLGVAYGVLDVFATWMNIALPILALSIVVYLVSFICSKSKKKAYRPEKAPLKDVLLFVSYPLFGIIIVSVVFIANLNLPDSVLQEYDNVHHLGVLRSFIETGHWSFLDVSAYGGIDPEIRAIKGWGFYPTVWHLTGALLSSSLNMEIATAANATNALYAALVFPAGMYVMLRALLKNHLIPMICGIFLSFAFGALPWKYMIWGPLFPNLASFALLPGVIFLFLRLFEPMTSKKERNIFISLFVCGVLVLAITQTNAVFTMAVFLIPFVVLQASRIPIHRQKHARKDSSLTKKRVQYGVIALFLIWVIWVICLLLPFMRETVAHAWPPIYTLPEALEHVALLAYNSTQPQYMLALLLLIGIIYTIKHREYFWMTCSYGIMCLILIICSTSSGIIKQAMGGFWYTDTIRLAASAAFFAIPLVCLGLSWLIHIPLHLMQRTTASKVIGGVIGALCIGLVFAPSTPLTAALGTKGAHVDIADTVASAYGPATANVYTEQEQQFVQRAKEITGDDLILNMPDDGSAFAYGVDGLDVFYRYTRTYGREDETEESRVIREGLNNIATDKAVQEAVDTIGAKYVIKLDQGDQGVRKNRYLFTYDETLWEGIDSIDDTTPGLELMLSENDMRLYKIIK